MVHHILKSGLTCCVTPFKVSLVIYKLGKIMPLLAKRELQRSKEAFS